jgi:hypothetical protein
MSQSGNGTGRRSDRADRSGSDKRRRLATLVPHIVCGVVGALFLLAAAPAHAEQFLPDLIHSSTVPANGDLNPYGVAFVPSGFPTKGSKLNPGDVLVSNFNNGSNLQGTGTTIISLTPNGEVAPSGTASVFFQGIGTWSHHGSRGAATGLCRGWQCPYQRRLLRHDPAGLAVVSRSTGPSDIAFALHGKS